MYEFDVHPRDEAIEAGAGVFLFARSASDEQQLPFRVLYVGQSERIGEDVTAHPSLACCNRRGADLVCVLLEPDPRRRLMIEADLLYHYEPPCNGRIPDSPDTGK